MIKIDQKKTMEDPARVGSNSRADRKRVLIKLGKEVILTKVQY
jgi:hypothetical protein